VRHPKEDFMSIIAWLIVGAIAGFVASRLVPGDEGYGVIGGLIAGIVGALLGGWLAGVILNESYMDEFTIGSIVAAIVGAIIVVFLWNMVARRRGTTV
jgi:uncharacterized membrane protein YeaQ/YmgE (transglycosylase-associated protein family)